MSNAEKVKAEKDGGTANGEAVPAAEPTEGEELQMAIDNQALEVRNLYVFGPKWKLQDSQVLL